LLCKFTGNLKVLRNFLANNWRSDDFAVVDYGQMKIRLRPMQRSQLRHQKRAFFIEGSSKQGRIVESYPGMTDLQ
jgi:hypothetical protein